MVLQCSPGRLRTWTSSNSNSSSGSCSSRGRPGPLSSGGRLGRRSTPCCAASCAGGRKSARLPLQPGLLRLCVRQLFCGAEHSRYVPA